MDRVRKILETQSLIALFAAFLLFVPFVSRAATLDMSPASASVAVGQSITVRVYVSADQSINAISGSLSFPPEFLSAEFANKSGSILTLWVQDPQISNADGTVGWSAVVPNPGFTGRGQVIAVTLRAKKIGLAHLSLASSQVLANDGAGTNVLTGTSGGELTITEALALPPAPAPQKVRQTPSAATTTATTTIIKAPIITDYPPTLNENDTLTVRGTSEYPGELARIDFSSPIDGATSTTSTIDYLGHFTYTSHGGVARGAYSISATVVTEDGSHSNPSASVQVTVGPSSYERWWVLFFILLLLLILFVVLAYASTYGWFRYRIFFARLQGAARAAEREVQGSFEHFKKDLERRHDDLQRIANRGPLSEKDKKVVVAMKREIEEAEGYAREKLQKLKSEIHKLD